ncbi:MULTISPECIES: hypothetical protein [unclassified Rhizobium]|uniref:hypothetical protein n=1 Tax=unclassified Rhizobium TaxID=2613769 RepID=UPI001446D9DF|nr:MULTISPECIES: hypothetical protein [unclassified Rhizobium]NKJ09843.1 hypothetical protein [Rhizobium sp. SG741]NKJ35194.1 hypothetical protein [Rhizobium sp. SG570]
MVPLKLTQAPDKSDQDENPPVDLVTSPSDEPGSDLDAPPVAALPVEVGEVEAPALDEFRQSSVEAPALAPLNATNKKALTSTADDAASTREENRNQCGFEENCRRK